MSWYGGKYYLVKKLVELIPRHDVYVEVFGGGAHLLFEKDPFISKLEVYNDIDEGLVNFFRVLRDEKKAKKLVKMVYLTPYSRKEYFYCRDNWRNCEDEVERAYEWYVAVRQVFASVLGKKSGWRYSLQDRQNVMTWINNVDRLVRAIERLKLVQVECLDFRELIRRYDSERTFFYCDPPYVMSTRKMKKAYEYEMDDKDHEDLIEILLRIKGKAMLSGYENDLYRRLEENGWVKRYFETVCHSQKRIGERRDERVEVVWMNYDIEKESKGMQVKIF